MAEQRRKGTKRQTTTTGAPGATAKSARAAKPAKPAKAAKPDNTAKTAKPAAARRPSPAAPGAAGFSFSRLGKGGPGAPKPMTGKERRERHQRAMTLATLARVAAGIALAALVLVAAYLVLRSTSAFSITDVECEPTEHVSEDSLQKLVQVPEGSTLLNVDTQAIEDALMQDPWVASVEFERVFPSTLKITVHEQSIDALVVMNSGTIAWYLGTAGSWIQPVKIVTEEGQSVNDAALAQAQSDGCLLIVDVPATVSPEAAAQATDEELLAVKAFREGFSDSFAEQVVCYSAPSATAVACTLKSGVYVSLGEASDIESKEKVATAALAKYAEGQVLSVNVRDPENAAIKLVDSSDVEAGDGIEASSSSE